MNTKQQLDTIYTPYCYLIGWSTHKKFYYGVRFATKITSNCLYKTGCHPDDFWVTYHTSSEYVKRFRYIYGEPDIIQIRKTFKGGESAVKWESKVIERLGAIASTNWLNRRNNSQVLKFNSGPLTERHKNNIRNSRIGSKQSLKTKEKISIALSGKIRSKEHCNNLKKSLTGIKKPSLMTGRYEPCIICNKEIYQTQYMITKGYIKKTCSKNCKSDLTRLNYLKRFNRV